MPCITRIFSYRNWGRPDQHNCCDTEYKIITARLDFAFILPRQLGKMVAPVDATPLDVTVFVPGDIHPAGLALARAKFRTVLPPTSDDQTRLKSLEQCDGISEPSITALVSLR